MSRFAAVAALAALATVGGCRQPVAQTAEEAYLAEQTACLPLAPVAKRRACILAVRAKWAPNDQTLSDPFARDGGGVDSGGDGGGDAGARRSDAGRVIPRIARAEIVAGSDGGPHDD